MRAGQDTDGALRVSRGKIRDGIHAYTSGYPCGHRSDTPQYICLVSRADEPEAQVAAPAGRKFERVEENVHALPRIVNGGCAHDGRPVRVFLPPSVFVHEESGG